MTTKLKTSHYVIGIAIVLIATGIIWVVARAGRPGPADALAQCLTEKGVKMYGAYWCPHCQNQKKKFGNSWQYVRYVECSLPGGRGQTQECNDAGIKGYPTWEFAEGKRLEGERSFGELAKAAGCSFEGSSEVEVDVTPEEAMPIPPEATSTNASS